MSKGSYYVMRVALDAVLRSNNAGPFKVLPAHKFLWGYEDKLVDMAKPFLSFKEPLPFDKFGVLANVSFKQYYITYY